MRASRLRLLVAPLAAVLIAACGAAAPSSSPSAPADDPAPAEARFRLRVTSVQALPPTATFGSLPNVVISMDGRIFSGGAMTLIYPGPLVPPVVERQLSAAGWSQVVDAARVAGLLGGVRDFTGGQMPPGSLATRLELLADGQVHMLIGDPSRQLVCVTTPCDPAPGTPEAFTGFVNRLSDLASVVHAADLGPERPYTPAGYAILVGEPPTDEQGLAEPPVGWPLAGGFGAFGKPLADGSGGRCGVIEGVDLAGVRGALEAADQLTRWRDPGTGNLYGMMVRPLLPGDADPCVGLV
jgi:hypothetical protein